MPTLSQRTRPSLRMESLEDRCLWSVGVLQPLSAAALPSVAQQVELLQPYPTPIFPFSTVSATLHWSDGVVSEGVVSVEPNGVLTVQTSRSLDPTQVYTVTLTIPATDTTEAVTLQFTVQPLRDQLRNPTTPAPPSGGFGSDGLVILPTPTTVVLGTGVVASFNSVLLVNLVADVVQPPKPVAVPPASVTPTAPTPVKPDIQAPPVPPVPVVVTIRIEPPLNRPAAQSQYVAGNYRVEVQVSPSGTWQQSSSDSQMLATTVRSLPITPVFFVATPTEIVEPSTPVVRQSSVVADVLSRPSHVTEQAVVDLKTLPELPSPAPSRSPPVTTDTALLVEAILSRFAAEVLPPEPITRPEETRAKSPPYLRWLTFAVLTSLALRTWIVPPNRNRTKHQF